ncbi:MAG: hypothetical protein L6247_02700 [Desulfobacteraceae bacterium]|nr:hypothetical protein [Desulfobacteraceae bacterium]
MGSSESGTIKIPPSFSIQRIDVEGCIPYFTLILLGMTTCPLDVTLDCAACIYVSSSIIESNSIELNGIEATSAERVVSSTHG